MKELLKNFLKLVFLFLRDTSDFISSHREISIICYHDVANSPLSLSIEMFEKQIEYLKRNNFYFVPLDEIVGYMEGRKELPLKTVSVTFDDGYEDIFLNAFPVLKKYEIPATVFIVGDFEKSRKNMEAEDENLSPLKKNQIEEMRQSGLIDFQYHSFSHRLLDKISENELKNEIKNIWNCRYFAYPGGHYSAKIAEALKKTGYKAAFSIRRGLIKKGDNIFFIRRNIIEPEMPFWKFRFIVSRANEWYINIINFLKNLW